MAKVIIQKEEWYPVLEICLNDDGSFPECDYSEIPDELLSDYKRLMDDFDAMQKKLQPFFK